ncbi:hypothetical protein F941_02922 [Acinetobacter bouvetii DSM 14964 = CIP 107468]|uniref:GmrSD restriction endonucleases N-terminal domain-containing protein n=1 Tax=Acinetobacter bouvetii DSM 14964 = CIP 107468 TaxID=1120925 RepID=N9DG45_9GAMM|nr:DUF262 domain-containing protein [Acinetobacter bouvetii]ENV81579.1 hypothetical protein F941_02922 [Acinetobacter bouvetii DSM 14964 = CIP 107468]BCU63651.1 hypothetical protein ACBO_04420 [Acinetobacter bouvetii]
MSDIKDTKSFSINDILKWKENGELLISPKYQRNKVWNLNAKSYLIDSIIRGYPIPQIFIRQQIDISTRQTIREVIDGQQRITAIIEFVDNLFSIQKSQSKEYGGKKYFDLSDEIKEDILNYNISFEIIKLKDDARIYEMFARLNTNNMALNKQELRNAQYWGEFKVFILQKTALFKEIFIDKKIFKDKDFSRMADVDFMNSLVINAIDGIVTDSAKKTDSYYKKFDKDFLELDQTEIIVNNIYNVIDALFYHPLFTGKIFYRKTYFYTLFAALNHQLYGYLGDAIYRNDKFSKDKIHNNINSLASKISLLESEILNYENDKDMDNLTIVEFEKHHRSRTTSKDERLKRVSILCEFLK